MKRFLGLSTIGFFSLTTSLLAYPIVIQAQASHLTQQQISDAVLVLDWRWLLPLLAIPLAILFWPSLEEESNGFYRGSGLVGIKGGKAKRSSQKKRLFIKTDKSEQQRITEIPMVSSSQ